MRHYVLTLTGSVQQLVPSAMTPVYGEPDDPTLRVLSLQPGGANGNPIYVGARPSLSDSQYGFRLEAGLSGVPPAPYILGEFTDGTVRLSSLYVLGTNGETLHVFTVPYL